MMRRFLQLLIVIIGLGLCVSPAQAQGIETECQDVFGSDDWFYIAKFDWSGPDQDEGTGGSFELTEGGNVTLDDPTQQNSGGWTSTVPVSGVIIKAGTGSDGAIIDPAALSGSYNNGFPNATSHITFCGLEGECGFSSLDGDDEVDRDARTVSNTILDDNGIESFEFTLLDNFEIVSSFPGYVNDGTTGTYEWKWDGTGDPPTSVDFTLHALSSGEATYFLFATNACGNTVQLDPPYDFSVTDRASSFALESSYPNPTRGQTTMAFSIAESNPVTLTVYDVMGRKVATVVDATLSSGTHTVTWNGRAEGGEELASGVYLVRLKAGDQVQTRRLTIVR